MKKLIILGILLILSIGLVSAIEECTGAITRQDLPCLTFLPLNHSTSTCNTITMSVYDKTSFLYSIKMSTTSNPDICNATFNISSLGTYTLTYTNGNFTDTGSIIVEDDNMMEVLLITSWLIGLLIVIISIWTHNRYIAIFGGFVWCTVGISLLNIGFGLIKNDVTNTIGIVTTGLGFVFIGVPLLYELEIIGG